MTWVPIMVTLLVYGWFCSKILRMFSKILFYWKWIKQFNVMWGQKMNFTKRGSIFHLSMSQPSWITKHGCHNFVLQYRDLQPKPNTTKFWLHDSWSNIAKGCTKLLPPLHLISLFCDVLFCSTAWIPGISCQNFKIKNSSTCTHSSNECPFHYDGMLGIHMAQGT